MSSLHQLLAQLIAEPSITPTDAGCQAIMMAFLQKLGFHCQVFDQGPVKNFYASIGTEGPLLVFAGHTDVVPVGEAKAWLSDPFQLTAREGLWYGRGVADMKGSLAAMLVMAERLVNEGVPFKGRLGFLITSGEEGDEFMHGTPHVMAALAAQGIRPDYCIVGEPSSSQQVGDTLKIGRRGSLSAHIQIKGRQGHVAYPHLAINAIHQACPALAELSQRVWDNGNDYFPPTTLQITSIQAGGQAGNIIPGLLTLDLNFRFSTEQKPDDLQQAVQACFNHHGLEADMTWRLNGLPFLTAKGRLLEACITAIQAETGLSPELSTAGGTSDGRFIAPYGVEVIELGPVNASIHQVNEWVKPEELAQLAEIYYLICAEILQGKVK